MKHICDFCGEELVIKFDSHNDKYYVYCDTCMRAMNGNTSNETLNRFKQVCDSARRCLIDEQDDYPKEKLMPPHN